MQCCKLHERNNEQQSQNKHTSKYPSHINALYQIKSPSEEKRKNNLKNLLIIRSCNVHKTLGEEITSLRVMFGTIMTKLNKLDNIEATIGDLSLSMEQLKTESAQVKTEVGLMKSEIKELKEKNKALEKRIIDNQSRSMCDNLVFYNVKEDEKFTEEEKVDTEAVLVKFIKEEMKVKSEIRFERVHRMGKAIRVQMGVLSQRRSWQNSHFSNKERKSGEQR